MDSIQKIPASAFPPQLKEIPDKPKRLYARGNLPNWDEFKFLCVVGSRKYTPYGKEVCEHLIAGLSQYPIVIVSGLAMGIDSIAHRAALKANLKTIAIPGSGLDWNALYPSSHRHLAEDIIKNKGCLISEFEPDFRATTWSFPQRNRIMAGMCHAVLIVEAENKSGTLITSKLATEYNRDVFAVPGSIFSRNSAGPLMLIKLGATPVENSRDIVIGLGLKTGNEETEKDYSDCSPEELLIIGKLVTPKTKEELLAELELPASDANIILSTMELKGIIKESMGEIRLS